MHTPAARRRPLFSDVDGTLCFVAEIHGVRVVGNEGEGRVLVEDPASGDRVSAWDVSTSSYSIYLAEETRRLLHGLRERFEIVLVTGGRPSTVEGRRRAFDFADAVICENGAVLLDRALRVDHPWHERLDHERRALGPVARRLEADGWRLDVEGRTSALRVRLKDNPHRSADEFAALCRDVELPPELKKTMNLENLDIILAGAGKDRAVRDYLARIGQNPASAVGIGDDVNDIEFLRETGTALVLGSAFPPLLEEARRRGWYISRARCFAGIQEILRLL